MEKKASNETLAQTGNGFIAVAVGMALLGCAWLVLAQLPASPTTLLLAALAVLAAVGCGAGLYQLNPNQAALLKLFGSYRGTDRAGGLRWCNPFFTRTKVSTRAHNFNSEKLKVNDLRGNPIEIAAAIVWRVQDTARCSFDVEDFESYVLTQAEAAVRHLASSYAYDNLEEGAGSSAAEITLRSGGEPGARPRRPPRQGSRQQTRPLRLRLRRPTAGCCRGRAQAWAQPRGRKIAR